jgi:hypothetical protein
LGGEGYQHVRPFGLGDGTFNNDMVNLVLIISTLPFGFEVCVLTFGDCEYGTMVGKFSFLTEVPELAVEVGIVVGLAEL